MSTMLIPFVHGRGTPYRRVSSWKGDTGTVDPLVPKHWCVGCDALRLWTLMAWTEDGRYLCAVCRGVLVYVYGGDPKRPHASALMDTASW